MAAGVRVYTYGNPGKNTLIARMTYEKLKKITEMEYFLWAGEYSPQLKYDKNLLSYYDGEYFQVNSFERDRAEFRADLERLNAEILKYREFSHGLIRYSIRCNSDLINSIAGLWWVKNISSPTSVKSLQIDPGDLPPLN